MLFLAVIPDKRGQGAGRALVSAAEDILRKKGARLLLVETSGADMLAPARSLYEKSGFRREAKVRDYYADGDDKIIFRKRL